MDPRTPRFNRPAPPRPIEPLDGVLPVDKPSGPTSHDVVDAVRRHFGLRKVGHGGTLDPQATGLLILLLGRGTKLADRFIGSDKTYQGVLRLGIATDTQDADGEVVREADPSGVTREQVEGLMAKLTGDLLQKPPMVSAVKVGGVPLYKRARKGQTVEREARLIHIYAFRMVDFKPPQVSFVLQCTKGTYVRTLCADIGDNLGCGAHLEQLRRTQSGDLRIADAIPLDQVLGLSLEELCRRMVPVSRFSAYSAKD